MKNLIKRLVISSSLGFNLFCWIRKWKQKYDFKKWVHKIGCLVPPPHLVKQKMLKEKALQYQLDILVETGTYMGEMIDAMHGIFKRIYSIELNYRLWSIVHKRYQSVRNVEIIHGDSGHKLREVCEELSEPALFWLDAHYSGGVTSRGDEDSPIYHELKHILSCRNFRHIILIDDARLFGCDPCYPSISQLKDFVLSQQKDVRMDINDDIIAIVPGIGKEGC